MAEKSSADPTCSVATLGMVCNSLSSEAKGVVVDTQLRRSRFSPSAT